MRKIIWIISVFFLIFLMVYTFFKPQKKIENPARKVYVQKKIEMGTGGCPILRIEHGLKEIDLISDKKSSKEIIDAQRRGAKAKVTLHVVDSEGKDVAEARVQGGFFNHGKKGYSFDEVTNDEGMLVLENMCVGDLNFEVSKSAYHRTKLRYWFYKNGYDCVRDGRWMPWNPTLNVVLKEQRNPISMYTKKVTVPFPVDTQVGFDCQTGSLTSPYGIGIYNDLLIRVSGEYRSHTNCSFRIILSSSDGGGYIRLDKDVFSDLKSVYEAPVLGYVSSLSACYVYDKARGIMRDERISDSEYIIFRSRVKIDSGGKLISASYGKIYDLQFWVDKFERNKASVLMSYYFNSVENDRNLEFNGMSNLAEPGWRDTNWPR